MTRYDPVRSGLLEMLGCFALMFFGSFGTSLPEQPAKQNAFFIENAMSHMFVYMAMMWVAAKHSGSQFNPLLSLALVFAGDLPISIAVVNIVAQAAGAFLGFFTLQMAGDYSESYFNYNGVESMIAVLIEALVAFTITLVFLTTFSYKQADRGVYGFAVPAIYALFTLSIGKIYYSRFNILLLTVNSVLALEFHANFLFVVIGAVVGTAAGAFIYITALKHDVRKDQIAPTLETENKINF